jgi:hypothetical protein
VSRSTPADAVTVSGLLAKRNWIGVNLTVGELNLDGATIQKSSQQGIQAFNESLSQIGLGVKNSLVQDNLNGGVSGTNLARLEMTGTLVCFNSAPARSIPGSPSLRSLGGIVMTGGVPVPLAFTGNTVYGNTADQVAILGETGQVWNLNGAEPNGSCGPDRNVFTNYNPTATPPGAGLVVSNATVSAVFDAWPVTPALGRDYVRLGTAAIDVGTGPSRSDFCSVIAADLTCSTVPDLP